MSRIRIVTDSTADIPADIRESLGIEMVPLKVHFGTDTYRDAVDLQPDDFFDKLAASPALPTTSQPSPVEFLETFRRLRKASDAPIISIHLSSGLSGTYQSALLAQSMLEQETDLTVLDSKSASYGFGVLVVSAAEAAQAGKSRDEIIHLVETMRSRLGLYFMVDTLEYLQKGGRIGKAAALIGSLLNIKPILSINDEGEVYSVDKVRGQKKAMARIVDLLKQDFEGQPVRVMIAHAKALASAEEIGSLISGQFAVQSLAFTSIGPVIGTHAGPGAVGVFVVPG